MLRWLVLVDYMGMYVGETEQVRCGNDFKPFHRHVLSEKSDILFLLFFYLKETFFNAIQWHYNAYLDIEAF